ncbi:MAG: hypothetical protein RSF40_04835 [Oscillospiraceae bacterium]
MATFHNPQINPFAVPQVFGDGNVQSSYLFNNYYVEFNPAWWRKAVNEAQQYSNLVYLDMMYSWCLQSSPFLVSQINKRIIPLYKRQFALKRNGVIDQELTDKYIVNSRWFKKYIRAIVMSEFYGVQVISVNPDTEEVITFPLRNIDIFNKAIREQTYEYNRIVNIADFDNMFYFQPESDQDFKLGMLQSISRAMIGIVEMYNNWAVLGKRYSFPMTTVGYMANSDAAKEEAVNVAKNIDLMSTPLIPFRNDNLNGNPVYQIEIKPVPTQSYADAFRVFKEYISEYRSEIMQLITGGTLLGATEKNTNSEQLANIHMNLFNDITDSDSDLARLQYNNKDNMLKLSRLFKDKRLAEATLVEIPDDTVSLEVFSKVGETLSKMGMRFTPESMRKVGMSDVDVDAAWNGTSWVQGIMDKVNGLFAKKK